MVAEPRLCLPLDSVQVFFFNLFILGCLGLCCCVWAFSSCGERGLFFVVVSRPLIAVASHVAEALALEHRLSSCGTQAQQLWCTGLVALQHVGSYQTRAQTRVPCIGRRILFIFFFINLFMYLFLAALGLHCCAWSFSSGGEQGLLFVMARGLLVLVTSLVVEHGLQARGLQQLWHAGSVVVAHGLQSAGSVVVVHRLSCSAARGIFPDQGSNPCPLHWQVGS